MARGVTTAFVLTRNTQAMIAVRTVNVPTTTVWAASVVMDLVLVAVLRATVLTRVKLMASAGQSLREQIHRMHAKTAGRRVVEIAANVMARVLAHLTPTVRFAKPAPV
jgi:hypothetical protein